MMRRGLFSSRFIVFCGTGAVLLLGFHFYTYIYKKNPPSAPVPSNDSARSRSSNNNFVRDHGERASNHGQQKADKIMSNTGNNNGAGGGGGMVIDEDIAALSASSEKDLMKLTPILDPRKQLKQKIVHLDLKGMPLLVKSYEELFTFFHGLGVTGILMEYEDTFPYHGRLKNISHRTPYYRQDIMRIQELAKSSHLEIIPLIQTFGHLEFVLKLEDFQSLREVPKYPQVICPTQNDSHSLIESMISQVMDLHSGVKYFHIGADEVYHIGQCPFCQDRMAKHKLNEGQLFLEHVISIAQYLKEKYKVKTLIWDDEFRKLDETLIQQSGISDLVEVIVWNYGGDVESRLPLHMWEKYARLFKNVWVGSAFKGANKPNSVLVNETVYLNNHYSWLRVMSQRSSLVQFKGIVLTGWQRYDHFSVLCELLPTAIPSLTACMKLLTEEGEVDVIPSMTQILTNVSRSLKCDKYNYLNYCSFPGSQIHQQIQFLEYFKTMFTRLKERNVFLGWAQEYNLNFAFSNPSHIESIYPEVTSLKMDLENWYNTTEKCMKDMFPNIEEWMQTNFFQFFNKLKNIHEKMGQILEKTTFPRRPLRFDSNK